MGASVDRMHSHTECEGLNGTWDMKMSAMRQDLSNLCWLKIQVENFIIIQKILNFSYFTSTERKKLPEALCSPSRW